MQTLNRPIHTRTPFGIVIMLARLSLLSCLYAVIAYADPPPFQPPSVTISGIDSIPTSLGSWTYDHVNAPNAPNDPAKPCNASALQNADTNSAQHAMLDFVVRVRIGNIPTFWSVPKGCWSISYAENAMVAACYRGPDTASSQVNTTDLSVTGFAIWHNCAPDGNPAPTLNGVMSVLGHQYVQVFIVQKP